jgi:hypothetical protein
VGHKGEIVNVTRHTAYYHLLPARLAVYPTEEYLSMFEKDRQLVSTKAKVSPYAQRVKAELDKLTLEIPMNFSADWSLTPDYIRIGLRYNKIVCPNESIMIPESLQITNKNASELKVPFIVQIKVNVSLAFCLAFYHVLRVVEFQRLTII